jgi:hypothetical protein
VLAALAGALVLSGIGIGIATAASGDDDPRPPELAAAAQQEPSDGFLARLAEKLEIDEATLKAAIEEALQEELDEAEGEGLLSGDLAERIRRILDGSGDLFDEEGEPNELGPLFPIEADLEALVENLAEFFGVSEEELLDLFSQGLSLDDVAEQFGKSKAEVEQFLFEQIMALLNDERIPEETRDLMWDALSRVIELYAEGGAALDDLFGRDEP